MRNLSIAAAFLAAACGGALASSSAEEIRSALVGNTFQGGMGGSDYASYFAADGTYKDKDGGGRYTIEADGVCYPDTDYGCYQATIAGDRLEWFKDGESQGKGVILKGNALKP